MTCGKWGWDFPPPPDAAPADIEHWIEHALDENEFHGCTACGSPAMSTTLQKVMHYIYCSNRPAELALDFTAVPINADAEWIRLHTPYWN